VLIIIFFYSILHVSDIMPFQLWLQLHCWQQWAILQPSPYCIPRQTRHHLHVGPRQLPKSTRRQSSNILLSKGPLAWPSSSVFSQSLISRLCTVQVSILDQHSRCGIHLLGMLCFSCVFDLLTCCVLVVARLVLQPSKLITSSRSSPKPFSKRTRRPAK
jgi:hypothetical protein